jgi:DNA-binding transcriptional MerR regulator
MSKQTQTNAGQIAAGVNLSAGLSRNLSRFHMRELDMTVMQDVFEPRPLYGIGTVARLTGLKPDTLRVWERRYGLGASHKTASGRRQYTQADLEHLQLISALVKSGARIGEIAKSERKTLEMLVRARGEKAFDNLPERKPKVVVVGQQLCAWLDQHQGCLSNTDTRLARMSLADVPADWRKPDEIIDALVVECPNLTSGHVARLEELVAALEPGITIVTYQFGNDRWLEELASRGFATTEFPPDPGYLAFELSRSRAEAAANLGESNLGDLMPAKPRAFSDGELIAARSLKSTLDCECPRHISDLIQALLHFEDYSASCSVDNWHDAAVHSCIYAYTGQARHLMEKALQAVLEERGAEFQELLRQERARRVNGASGERNHVG